MRGFGLPAPVRRAPVVAATALLLLAGACGSTGSEWAEDTPEHRACRAEARSAPEVRALARQVRPGTIEVGEPLERERFVAEVRAFRDCLRRAGVAEPGGVEPVVPRGFGTRALRLP
jgi:hypothetical protein